MKDIFPARLVSALAALAMTTPVFSQPSLDARLRAAVARGDVPGVVAIAGDRRGVIYEGAFGLAESATGRAMTADAIFNIASMGKALTSVAAMQLVEAGKLALDDPAAKYLPELATLPVIASLDPATGAAQLRPPVSPITVRQLFTHTSGLSYALWNDTLKNFKPRPGEKFPIGPLAFDPGTRWNYGTGVDQLGRIVEKISGQNLEEYFRAHLFAPLGMDDTFYNVPAAKHARVVNSHQRRPDGTLAENKRTAPAVRTSFSGGGGLYSTAADYLKFLRMLLNGGELDGKRVLARETVAQMGQNHIGAVRARALKTTQPESSSDFTFIDDGHDQWGLGFLITTRPVAGKRRAGSLSWGGISNTYFWYDPASGVAGVIMMQFRPFADAKALGVYDAFERGVYELGAK
jgi:methyl acetate hydrolase